MHDVVPTSTRNPFAEPYPPPPSLHHMYTESSPPEDQYWAQGHEHGRSKYKKRSVCPTFGYSLISSEPRHLEGVIVVILNQRLNGDVVLTVHALSVMLVVYVQFYITPLSDIRLCESFKKKSTRAEFSTKRNIEYTQSKSGQSAIKIDDDDI